MYIKDYSIQRWGTSQLTYEALNIYTNASEFVGSLRECLDYCKGQDAHANWSIQSWECGYINHLPEHK